MNKENEEEDENFPPMSKHEYRVYGGLVFLVIMIVTILLNNYKP